ncbi:MAG: hypothetical protein WAW96_10520 [Alphaproteobacteria bacterium]
MSQRLPLVFSLGALSLLASALPSYAEVTPMHRPPAVPPLPVQTQQAPPAQEQPADPIALKRDGGAQGLADIALSTLGHGIDFGHPAPAQIALTAAEPADQTARNTQTQTPDAVALKRDGEARGFADIALSTLGRGITFGQPASAQIALAEAPQEVAKRVDQTAANVQAQPAQDAPSAPSAQSHGDIANFLPDIDLKSISQDPGLGYHASIAPFTAEEAVAEAAPSSEKAATLAAPDVTPSLKVTVAFNYSEPLSLFIMPAEEEITGATHISNESPPTKPRQRPHNLIASNEEHASEARPLAAKGEPVFELRR